MGLSVNVLYEQEKQMTDGMQKRVVEFDGKQLDFLQMTSVDQGLTLNSVAYALGLTDYNWLLNTFKKNRNKFERTNNWEAYSLKDREYSDELTNKCTPILYREAIIILALMTNSHKKVELANLVIELIDIKNQD